MTPNIWNEEGVVYLAFNKNFESMHLFCLTSTHNLKNNGWLQIIWREGKSDMSSLTWTLKWCIYFE